MRLDPALSRCLGALPQPTGVAGPSRRMTEAGSLRGVPVVDENSRPVEQARLEVLQRLLCS
jgi:hypothetical protein